MAYIDLPNVNENDPWTAADHNKLRDNFIASVPDIFTAKGDIAVGTGTTTLVPVAGNNEEIFTADSGEASGTKWIADIITIPIGGIIMWSGNIVNIPSWWKLCDGNNGTIDLTDQFVVGAGDTYAVDATGGSSTGDWSHTHSGTTGSGGEHTHGYTVEGETGHTHDDYESGDALESITVAEGNWSWGLKTDHHHKFDLTAVAHTHTNRDGTSSSNSNHTHSVGPCDESGSDSLDIRPPYYALAYIQRIS